MWIDVDANATYNPDEECQGVIAAALAHLGNPSSLHRGGQRAKAAIERAREAVRQLAGADSRDHVVFTSGATEANNTVIGSVAQGGGGIVSSAVEHPCILAPLARLSSRGADVVCVAPDRSGIINPSDVAAAVTRDTCLVSIMSANNETGVMNDIAAITRLVRERAPNAVIHTDAAQSIGKTTLSFSAIGVDCMTISGHKIGALSGVGALIVRDGITIEPLILGGSQEMKLRGGTENVLGIISLEAAARGVIRDIERRIESMRLVRDLFEGHILASISNCEIHGSSATRLPNTSSVSLLGTRADDVVVAMDQEGIRISAGAACSSGKPEPSHVLSAMGLSEDRVRATVRVSFRADQKPEIVDRVVEALSRVVSRARAVSERRGNEL